MNKTTTHYFMNLFVRKKKILLLYMFVCFMSYPFLMLADLMTNRGLRHVAITQGVFYVCLAVLGILASVLPIFTFKFSLTKRNVDTYYSLPINRDHLFKAHFFAPILGTCVPILMNYLIGGLFLLLREPFQTYLGLLLCLLLAFIAFILIYSIVTFFVLKCNNILDACIITASFVILPVFVYMAVSTFLQSQIIQNGMVQIDETPSLILRLLSPYNTLFITGGCLSTNVKGNILFLFEKADWIMFIYDVVVGVGAFFASYLMFKKKKGESAEQLSKDWMTYPLMSNIGLISLMLCFNLTSEDFITSVMIILILFVIFVLVNGIAKRSMRVSGLMIVEFAVLLVLINGFNYVSKQTQFFGLNTAVLDYHNYESVKFEYWDDPDSTKEGSGLSYEVETAKNKEADKKLMEYLVILQKNAALEFKETGGYYREYGESVIHINYGNGIKPEVYVWYKLDKNGQSEFLKLLEACRGE